MSGNTSPAKTAQVTAAKGMPPLPVVPVDSQGEHGEHEHRAQQGGEGSAGRAVSAVFSMDSSPYTHTGTRAAAAAVRGIRGLPFSPAAACISSQAPMEHMAATSTMVAQSGAQPRIAISSGRPTTATITRLNIPSALSQCL